MEFIDKIIALQEAIHSALQDILIIPSGVAPIANFIFMLCVGFYLMQNLQWFNYSVWRTFTKHTKYRWHLIYLLVPFVFYFMLGDYFLFYLVIHIVLLSVWYFRLDKKLVFTNRVKRFFITLTIFLSIDFGLRIISLICQIILVLSRLWWLCLNQKSARQSLCDNIAI